MVKKNTSKNKAMVQDWQSLLKMDNELLVLRAITQREIAALVTMTEYLKWRTRFDNPPTTDILEAFSAETEYDLTRELNLCEELAPCLNPIRDSLARIEAGISQLSTNLNELIQTSNQHGNKLPPPVEAEDINGYYAGALAVVQHQNKVIRELYAEAEAKAVDNTAEFLSLALRMIPALASFGLAEAFEFLNAYFQQQQDDYIDDYPAFEEPAAFDLACRAQNAGGFSQGIWTIWTDGLVDLVPANAAARVFHRWSPSQQTFLNRIAETLNGNDPLITFIGELTQIFYNGSQTPIAPPAGYQCDPHAWCADFDFEVSDGGWRIYESPLPNRPYGQYIPSIGWQSTSNSVPGQGYDATRLYIYRQYNPLFVDLLTTMDLEYIASGTFGALARVAWVVMNASGATIKSGYVVPKAGTHTASFTLDAGDGPYIGIAVTGNTTAPGQGVITIKQITLRGTGIIKPWQGYDCT